MIAWVHSRGKSWGHWRRRNEEGWPKTSLMARIRDEGSVGAAIKENFQRIPVKLMPKEIADFHRVWLTMDELHRGVVEVIYRAVAHRDKKAEALGMSKSSMYRVLDEAHGYLSARLDIQEAEFDRKLVKQLSQVSQLHTKSGGTT